MGGFKLLLGLVPILSCLYFSKIRVNYAIDETVFSLFSQKIPTIQDNSFPLNKWTMVFLVETKGILALVSRQKCSVNSL